MVAVVPGGRELPEAVGPEDLIHPTEVEDWLQRQDWYREQIIRLFTTRARGVWKGSDGYLYAVAGPSEERCVLCDQWTHGGYVQVGGEMGHVCAKHFQRD